MPQARRTLTAHRKNELHPQRVDELMVELGEVAGHHLVLLSLEVYPDWADLRYARRETPGAAPLPRRVPRPSDWSIDVDGEPATVVDAVGRGDRAFSNGEVRVRPAPGPGSSVTVRVHLHPSRAPLATTFSLPERE